MGEGWGSSPLYPSRSSFARPRLIVQKNNQPNIYLGGEGCSLRSHEVRQKKENPIKPFPNNRLVTISKVLTTSMGPSSKNTLLEGRIFA